MESGFGRTLRAQFLLQEDGAFLNHGSFGACPIPVLREQERIRTWMETQPDEFFTKDVVPRHRVTAVRSAATAIAEFVSVSADNVALVENATTGTQSVLQSVDFRPGDEILITNHQYNAVRLAVEQRCKETGAIPNVVQIPMPTNPDDVRKRYRDASNKRVKLAIVDHITSPTALLFPLAEIIEDLHALGILVHVDGAHAVGQIPLNVAELKPDWYTSNVHKWLYGPKGTAFFYASPAVAPITRPVLTSHFIEMGFPRSFDYCGTRDNSGWLAIPAAIAFFNQLGAEKFRRHNHALVERGTQLLQTLGAKPIAPIEMSAAMRAFILPQRRATEEGDGEALKEMLWADERIQVNSNSMMGALLIRFCAQAYVDDADLERLHSALEKRGWPGR
ncbi:MAG TPA: aminotransferase class V-fold PLP-dependent enzyme [Candidatus Baltobacteraceae bacterium]|jgi:isopenicillin-N epimerase